MGLCSKRVEFYTYKCISGSCRLLANYNVVLVSFQGPTLLACTLLFIWLIKLYPRTTSTTLLQRQALDAFYFVVLPCMFTLVGGDIVCVKVKLVFAAVRHRIHALMAETLLTNSVARSQRTFYIQRVKSGSANPPFSSHLGVQTFR